MKVLVTLALLSFVSLGASGAAWVYAARTTAPTAALGDPNETVAAFRRAATPLADIDLGARYRGRSELLDPRTALPSWHRFARADAVRARAATRACPPDSPGKDLPPTLRKAVEWHAATCAGGAPPIELIESAPFLHPSGRSYAALGDEAASHAGAMHVLELAAVDPTLLDAEERALARLPRAAWEGLARGDSLVLTARVLVLAERNEIGIERLRIYDREAWDAFSRTAALALVSEPSATCARPASSAACWEPRTLASRRAPALVAWSLSSATLFVIAVVLLALRLRRDRARLREDRLFVLRTLTHELRTPATTLRLDIEPLRAAYDELPRDCQEPLLRVSDGVERMLRVLHTTARYMALFEPRGAGAADLLKIVRVSSARAMLEEMAESWPEGVTLAALGEDGPLDTDPEWLGVALRNLVENATRHGAPPVRVTWRLQDGNFITRVTDAGDSRALSFTRAIEPFGRAPQSAGLGLGLAIVHRVARLFGGALRHSSAPTTFELEVPARRRQA
ncbi:MAG: HAMP domain-containing sensor histidine kinase [Polyangiaceae bacterium]